MNEAKNVLAPFVLAFSGLKEGVHTFDREITATFFDAFEYNEFIDAQFVVHIELTKKASLLELQFSIVGSVTVACDLSNEPFALPLEPTYELVVKFGETYNDENEHLLVLPHGSHQVDVAQTLFETIVLAVPQKRVHPSVADGSMHKDVHVDEDGFLAKPEARTAGVVLDLLVDLARGEVTGFHCYSCFAGARIGMI